MQITFRINADSEAVFAPSTLKALREQGDVIALDWLRDVIYEADKLYHEMHEVVFVGAYAGPTTENDALF